ncbi:chemotaxis protein CheB [Mycobacterium vicinigordonae]|uniref:protein-glutamate methylesterase n=2 Tax=Mycobacterium vicinigordonae TaxID=1719132 RepID=A0A7D6EAY8_9MYCO|nr:chemotaxis protein CheB [Mycobacterium vicinigordonae]
MVSDVRRTAIDVVALLASAGGLHPLSTVLHDLPSDFPAAIVVQQHLGGHSSVLPAILARNSGRHVTWAQDGQILRPGEVVVCPPAMHLELSPDRSCRLRALEKPYTPRFDVLLASLARSYGPRGLAVVLSGLGHDGAEGTKAMERAGALVIAESSQTAQFSSMPTAAAQAGAELVLPVAEIGRVVTAIVMGASSAPRRGPAPP